MKTRSLMRFTTGAAFALIMAALLAVPSYAQFNNGGFESGAFNDWSLSGGLWRGGGFMERGDPGKSAIVSQGYDPLLLNLGVYKNMVFSGNYAARVNNSDNGWHFSTISQTVSNWSAHDICFEWLAVLEEPGHEHGLEPFFRIILTDLTKSITLLDRFYSSDTIPAEILHTVSDGRSVWKFTDWQQEHIDTHQVIGDTLTLRVMAADCTLGGHGGYVYVDGFSTNCVCVRPPPGLRAWWPFDEPTWPIANDIAGTVNNQGAYFGNPTPVAGVVSNALCFNGTNDYVLVTNQAEINFIGSCSNGAESFTIDAWIRANVGGPGTQTLLDKRINPASPQGYSFFLHNGNPGIQIADGTSWQNYYGTTNDLRDGLWHFIAVTVARCTNNVNAGTIYVDGNVVHTFTDPHTGDLNNSADLYIACRNPAFGTNYYSGCMDELEIYKRALTAWEINGIFNAGSAGKCKTNCYCASISGYKYNDLNGNGVWDDSEPKLTNWTIRLSDGQTAVTDAEGNYNFTDLLDGTYIVTEEAVGGWAETAPTGGSYTVTLAQGQSTNGLAFGNTTTNFATISGVKFNDLNHNGVWDPGEPVLTNWVIQLFRNGHVLASTTTDSNGYYQFTVPPGFYGVGESDKPGWQQVMFANGYYVYFVTVSAGQVVTNLNFGNTTNVVAQGAIAIDGSVTNNGSVLHLTWNDPSWLLNVNGALPGTWDPVPIPWPTNSADIPIDMNPSKFFRLVRPY